MLEYIKLGDCKIETIQIEDEWFVPVLHIGTALGVSSDTIKRYSTSSFTSAI